MSLLPEENCYPYLPILVHQALQGQNQRGALQRFVSQARRELAVRELSRQERLRGYQRQLRSRRDRRLVEPCFEAETRTLHHASASLDHLERYLLNGTVHHLREALADFKQHENFFEKQIRLRLRLPGELLEDLLHAA